MVKIVKKWPLQEFVNFTMTPAQQIKAIWIGATKVVPFIAYGTAAVTFFTVVAALTKFCPTTSGDRKYSKKIEVYRPGDPRYARISTYSKLDE